MNPLVKKDILNVLQQAVEIIKQGELFKLRELSDHVIHNAAVFQDKDSITVAVTIYSLSKIYKTEVDQFVLPHLGKAITFLEQGNLNEYESEMKLIIQDISHKDSKTKFYVQEVLERAQIKKASKMFEHGISLGQVADALGISMWEIMDYVGKTRIVDQFEHKTNVHDKLNFTRSLFG
jgi:predicted DNA-binding protein YlxM (UPF0122 family)